MYPWSPLPRNASAALRDATHAKSSVRLSAVADLARFADGEADPECVEQLIALVAKDEDVEVRAAAALALADASAASGLPVLLNAASAGAPRVRQRALVAIGELAQPGDEQAAATLRPALGSEAPALRFQALVAAGRLLSGAELSEHLARALTDPEPKLRHIACRIAEERFFPSAAAGDGAVLQLWEERLVARLSDPDADVVLAAAVVLAPRGVEAARAALVHALNRRRSFPHLDDEQAAIELCGELSLQEARPGLRARAFGGWLGATPLAFHARVALARLGDERARRTILRGLSSFRRSVRAESVAAAGQARLEAARPRLLELRERPGAADAQSVREALSALDR